jgi:hypothetical protein
MPRYVSSKLPVPGRGAAQEKAKSKAPESKSGHMCPMMEKMKQQEVRGRKDIVTWWQRGIMSQKLQQVLSESGALLSEKALKKEARQQLAGVLRDVGELLPKISSPRGVQNPDELDKKLADLETTLAKIKAQTKP